VVRCENCGYENPAGALVCRRCRHRLVIRRDGGPRRESEAELTLVVAAGLTRLAAAFIEAEQTVARAGEPLAEIRVTIACLGPRGRPVRLPLSVRDALSPLVQPS